MTDINTTIVDRYEILFWKVFHNKYLFNLIIQQIESNEWVEIKDISDYHIGNRMKFKHIQSLEWMIKNELFPLLKYKLEAGEQVEIDQGIHLLFLKRKSYGVEPNLKKEEKDKFILNQIKTIGYYRPGDEKSIIQRNEKQFSNKESFETNYKQTMELLIKYKRDELVGMNILNIVFSYFIYDLYQGDTESNYQINKEMLEMVLNEPNSFPVTDKVFQYVIEWLTVPTLELILNSSTTLEFSNNFKNNSISWASNNGRYYIEMIEFILNNPQLYNIPSTSTSKSTSTSTSTSISTLTIAKIKFTDIFSIYSENTINKLYQLNYLQDDIGTFNGNGEDGDGGGNGKPLKSWFQFLNVFKFSESSKEPIIDYGDDGGKPPFKDIFKFYSSKKPVIYFHYLNVYDEMIDGCNIEIVYEYAIKNKSVNALKYLLEKGYKRDQSSTDNSMILSTIVTRYKRQCQNKSHLSNEFIKVYTNNLDNFQDIDTDTFIFKYIHSIKSSEREYLEAYNSISNQSPLFKSRFSLKWFEISQLIIKTNSTISPEKLFIQNTDDVDLVMDCLHFIKYFNNYSVLELLFQFKTFQTIEYSKTKYPTALYYSNQIYDYPCWTAIFNCDINQLKQFPLDKILCDTSSYFGGPSFKIQDFDQGNNGSGLNFNNQTTSNLIELLDYLNLTGYKQFHESAFIVLVKCICSATHIDLSSLKIDFNKHQNATIELFLNSITDKISPSTIQLILSNYNLFNNSSNVLFERWNEIKSCNSTFHYYCYSYNGDSFTPLSFSTLFYDDIAHLNDGIGSKFIYCTSNDSIQDIISTINLLLGHLNNNNQLVEMISNMINDLFKRLIRVANITIEKVEQIYQLISLEWLSVTSKPFKFQHSLYHIIYYLGIKSLKYIKFILSHPSIIEIIFNQPYYNNENIGYENDDFFISTQQIQQQEDEEGVEEEVVVENNVLKYLNPIKYTYEFIFNSSFKSLFNNLIQDLVYSISPNENLLNRLLIYILEIREIDLLFENLEIIKQHQITDFKFDDELVSNAYLVLNDQLFKEFTQYYI